MKIVEKAVSKKMLNTSTAGGVADTQIGGRFSSLMEFSEFLKIVNLFKNSQFLGMSLEIL